MPKPCLMHSAGMATLSNYVSVSGGTIDIHDVSGAHYVIIYVAGQTFTDLNDMIAKTNFQTT